MSLFTRIMVRLPECIVDVPDEVQANWRWNEEKQVYVAPLTKDEKRKLARSSKPHSDLLEVVAEKIGVPYESLIKEVMERKKARHKSEG